MAYNFPWWYNRDNKTEYILIPLGTITIQNDCSTVISNNEIRINGEKIPNPPCKMCNTTIINNKVYVDGYEYKNGKWKKTFAALWHKWF